MTFTLSDLRNSNVWAVYRIKSRIQMDPLYQREGDIWPLDKKQLLIDTIINQFDVPKIYLHKFTPERMRESEFEYSVIDGKQRLSTIFQFIDGIFALSAEFEFLRPSPDGDEVVAGGMTYADLARRYPLIKTDFDAYPLDIVCIETQDSELIEELFSRLNEAVPLNAPEKRNALPGPLPAAARRLVQHRFFTENLPFSNRRYRHLDLAAKMLLAEFKDDVVDTKKAYLDKFFEDGPDLGDGYVERLIAQTEVVLNRLADVFIANDPLLRQVGMVFLYYLVFRVAIKYPDDIDLNRAIFDEFEQLRVRNRAAAEEDIAGADYLLLEFDRYSQSPNDAVAIRFRLDVIDRELFGGFLDTLESDQNLDEEEDDPI